VLVGGGAASPEGRAVDGKTGASRGQLQTGRDDRARAASVSWERKGASIPPQAAAVIRKESPIESSCLNQYTPCPSQKQTIPRRKPPVNLRTRRFSNDTIQLCFVEVE
jgi:hypothetical protein